MLVRIFYLAIILFYQVKVPKAIKDLLEKPATQRSAEDLYAISSMMREMPSFRKYTRDMQTMLCRIVRYMKCGRRRVVLRKGHIGYSVYFIFSGSVNVVLDRDEQNVFAKERILTLKKGACFGEVALMQNTRRNATIVCADATEFLVVDKEDFLENGLDKQMQEEFIVRYKFFKSWFPVHHWTDDEIRNLSSICRTEEFHHNRLVAKDTTKNDWLCFVIEVGLTGCYATDCCYGVSSFS
ncbi:hypothetical protein CAPTEDRAFT_133833 [Capitella teleta]|uniref:Cyclic nucleotide-binding domain-containing protein 2 n=1 Tax=Capitella teleta TaxID=283909 RepID=R7U0X9_CAPTE|nr:hypothetical protein CAPTEDRAFT_133833 [Capitella teleta]|eukprot:ELT99853.1 hypothetical protein CAPTEDRAFT_133833 [Capitella teleta]